MRGIAHRSLCACPDRSRRLTNHSPDSREKLVLPALGAQRVEFILYILTQLFSVTVTASRSWISAATCAAAADFDAANEVVRLFRRSRADCAAARSFSMSASRSQRYFDLSKQVHYLLRLISLTSCHRALLVSMCLLATVTKQAEQSTDKRLHSFDHLELELRHCLLFPAAIHWNGRSFAGCLWHEGY